MFTYLNKESWDDLAVGTSSPPHPPPWAVGQEVVRITSSQRLYPSPEQHGYREEANPQTLLTEEPQTLIPGCQGTFLPGCSGHGRDWQQVSFSSHTGCGWGRVGVLHYHICFIVIDVWWDLLRAKAKLRSELWRLGRGRHVIQPPLSHLPLLPFAGLAGRPGLPLPFYPYLLPSSRLCYQLLIPWCDYKQLIGKSETKVSQSLQEWKTLSPMTGVLAVYMDVVLGARNLWTMF